MKTMFLTLAPARQQLLLQAVVGSLLIALMAQVKISFGPVPYTLQTFAVFLVALFLDRRAATAACCCYLIEATAGLPVLAGFHSDPLWVTSMTAGYLVSFPFVAYMIGFLKEQWAGTSWFMLCFSVLFSSVILFGLGVSWLAYFVGWSNAIIFGLTPFVASEITKAVVASGVYAAYKNR